MGFELVYCFKCQKRLTEADFRDGKAFRVGIQTTCIKCADELLAPLSPEQRHAVLNPVAAPPPEGPESPRPAKPSKGNTPRGATAAAPHFKTGLRSTPPTALIVGAVVVVLIVVGVLLAGRKSPDEPPKGNGGHAHPDKTVTAPPPKAPPADPAPVRPAGPIPVFDGKREDAAKAALQKARDFAKAHPDDLLGQVRLYEQAEWEAEKTACADDVRREKEAAQKRLAASLGPALNALEEEIRAPLDRREYQRVLDALASARPRHAFPGWGEAVDRKIQETQTLVDNHFDRLKTRAQEAFRSGSANESQRCREEAATWGIRKYVDEVEQILKGPSPAPR